MTKLSRLSLLLVPAVASLGLAAFAGAQVTLHFETAPYPTHNVAAPPACGSTGYLYGLNPLVASVGGNPGRVQFTMPTWALGIGFGFQAIALDTANSCVRVSDPLTVTIQAP